MSERQQFPLEPVSAQDSRAEWIGWALDTLRRYAPDPVTEAPEPYTDEAQDAEAFFNEQQSPSDSTFR